MADLQKLLHEAYEERSSLDREIQAAAAASDLSSRYYQNWDRGILFKRIFAKSFAARKETFDICQAKLDELREQLRLTTLATHIDIDPEQAEPYYRMRDELAAMAESKNIWDTLERRSIDRIAERSAASELITREPVSFELGSCDLIQWDKKVLHLPNRTGGDLYIYPGFVLYRAARKAFAIIDSREVSLIHSSVKFIESDKVPSDATVVGQAWAESNKDGTPDRRFRDNYQIPVVLYGTLRFTSPGGLQEEFQVSNAELANRFAKAWTRFHVSFARTDPSSPRSLNQRAEEREPSVAFVGESDKARALVLEKGEFWEYLLTQELLEAKLAVVGSEYAAFDQTLWSTPMRRFRGSEFMPWLSEKLNEITPMVERMAASLNHGLRAAWGASGEAGDPVKILNTVDDIIADCRGFVDWELAMLASAPPLKLRRLPAALRGIAGSIINDIRHVPRDLGCAVDGARRGIQEFNLRLEFSSPPQIAKFMAEMDIVNRHPEWADGE